MTTKRPAPVHTEPPRRPFDARKSLHLDAIIVKLDAQPRGLAYAWLKAQKALVEYRAGVIVGGAHHG